MSDYDKFFGSEVDVSVAGISFKMKPLTVADLGLLKKLENPDTQVDSIKKVLCKTLNPEIKPEEVERISLNHFPKLLEKIMEVNGIEKPDDTPSLKS